MGSIRAGILAIGALALAACASSPAPEAPKRQAKSTAPQEVVTRPDGMIDGTETNDSGIGTLANNGRDLIDCGRKRRLGTRIPRRVCDPTSFNSLYPSAGINMGTARESQPGYGSH